MIFHRRFLSSVICAAPLLLAGCSVPHVMGLGSYYAVTDAATGRVYYTAGVSREGRGVVEFKDSVTGAWVSLPAANVAEITEAQFRAGPPSEERAP